MPLELQIIRANEFIRLGAEGHFDLTASKTALAELANACRKRGIDQAMLDLRALHLGPIPVFTPGDLAALMSTFQEVGFTQKHRLAVLYQSDPHRRARLFAFLSSMHGWNVRAFGDFTDALAWLSSEEELPPRRRGPAGEKKILVRFQKSRKSSSAVRAAAPRPRVKRAKKSKKKKRPSVPQGRRGYGYYPGNSRSGRR